MVKDIRYIIKRIIIGVGIAICLMYLKGGLIGNVSAKELFTLAGQKSGYFDWNNTQYPQQTFQFGNAFSGRGSGYLLINLAYRNELTNDFPVFNTAIVETTNQSYFNCYFSATTGVDESTVDNVNNFYSGTFVCPVNFSSTNGGFYKFHIRFFTRQLSGRYYYRTGEYITFVKDDDNSDVINAIEEQTQAQNDTNNTLKDSSTDDPTSDINSMSSKVASNNSITRLLTLPITLYQNILNSVNGTCSTYNLGSLFGTNLTLPCINIESLIGSNLWAIIDILFSGLFILSFRKKMVDIFNNMSSLKDRGNELE